MTRSITLLCMVLGLAGCATIPMSENDLLYPDQSASLDASVNDYRIDAVEIRHADGAVSRGVWMTPADARATVVYFGGNQFRLDQHADPVIRAMQAAGVSVVIVDHRGYGRSDGQPTMQLLRSDALDVVDYVRARRPGRVVLYGHSIGSFIAAGAAAERAVDGLILEGTSTTATEWAHSLVPWYAKPFVTVQIDDVLAGVSNVAALSRYRAPLLILAGAADTQTPARLAKKLFATAPSADKRFVRVPKGGHDSVLDDPLVQSALRDFLADRH